MKLRIFFNVVLLLLLACSHQGALAQESGGRTCPVITISNPKLASTGGTLIYKANIVGGDPAVTPTLSWTVSTGKVISGQGTAEVTVDVEGNNSTTVTITVTGYPASCLNKASYSWIVDRPSARKYNEYANLKFTEERLRLDQFATELQREPKATGYIVVYDNRDTVGAEARARGEKARKYLVKEHGFKEAQIVVVNGGYREKSSVELFIAPDGALPPTPAPDEPPK